MNGVDLTTTLTTPRLVLRRARAGDETGLHPILSDPQAMSYWSTLPHVSFGQTQEWLATMIADREAGLADDFIVTLDSVVIGKCGFWRPPEIGYILHPDYWGQGLASEALSATLSHGFGSMGLARVTADVDPRNAASLRLLTRHGFVETSRASRTWKIGEHWADSVYLALERTASEPA